MSEIVKVERFNIIGISTETINENGKAAEDLGKLWNKFYSENIREKIPGKVNKNVYAIYTDYESNYKGKYTAMLGFKVHSLNDIPDGLLGREFEGQEFEVFTAKGNMPEAIVNTWKEIWDKDEVLNRSYIYDFELYRENSMNGENSEVEIFIGKKTV